MASLGVSRAGTPRRASVTSREGGKRLAGRMWPPPPEKRDANTGPYRNSRLKTLARATSLVVALMAAFPPALAQSQPAGWYLLPSLRLTEEFDDNVFVTTSGEESDFITRVSPLFKGGFQSAPFTLLANFSFDAEAFAEHPELSGVANRRAAGLELHYVPTRPLTLGFNGSYAETQTPGELNTLTGIQVARATATLWSVSPTVAYKFSLLTSGDAAYSYATSTISGGLTTVVHQAQLNFARQLTPLDTGTLGYGLSLFETDGTTATSGATSSTTFHTITVGWNRRLTERTTVSLRAGPRISENGLNPEVDARLDHRFELGTLTLAAYETETNVVGQAGSAKAEGVSASLRFNPFRPIGVDLATGVQNTSTDGGRSSVDVTVYSATASVSYRIARWLSATATYRFYHQEQRPASFDHNIFSISLDVNYPVRVH